MKLPVGYFDRRQTGDILSHMSYDIDTVNTSLSTDLVQILTSIITIVGAFSMMVRISPMLVLVFVVLGGLGRMWGSIIAAAALTVLPEMLREFSEYRMLIYAIVLILVMLATNNPTLKNFFGKLFRKITRKGAEEE